jgi:hypothetical protein
MRPLIMAMAAMLATLGPVLADGLLVPPPQVYPVQPQPSQSCLMNALQLGYQTTGGVSWPTAPPRLASRLRVHVASCCPTATTGRMCRRAGRRPAGHCQCRLDTPDESHRPIRDDPARIRHGNIGAANNHPRCQWSDHHHDHDRQQWAADIP